MSAADFTEPCRRRRRPLLPPLFFVNCQRADFLSSCFHCCSVRQSDTIAPGHKGSKGASNFAPENLPSRRKNRPNSSKMAANNNPVPHASDQTDGIVEKLAEEVKEWKKDELFKRSISESPELLTGNTLQVSGSNALGGSSCNLSGASGSKSKFGSTFSIIKHKRVELTTYSDERLDDVTSLGPALESSRSKKEDDFVMLEENVMKKAASINFDHSNATSATSPKNRKNLSAGSVVEPESFFSGVGTNLKNLSECDTFEGRSFVKWIAHTLASDHYLKVQLTEQDLKFIGKNHFKS